VFKSLRRKGHQLRKKCTLLFLLLQALLQQEVLNIDAVEGLAASCISS
jgi:hypothetical protein